MGISEYALELYDNSSFEKRDSQRNMISYIGDSMDRALAIEDKCEKVCMEAPTGTGKSLGILFPALAAWLLYGKRTVIATGTHVLQDQLYTKDIPALIKAVSVSPESEESLRKWSVRIVKGRNGSYCLKKLDDLLRMVDVNGPFMTKIGADIFVADKLKLEPLKRDIMNKVPRLSYPDHHPLMNYIRSDKNTCTGTDCPYCAKQCPYYTGLRFNSPLLITNHALLLAFLRRDFDIDKGSDEDTESSKKTKLGILNGDFYFFDEAHHLMGYRFGGTKTLEVSDSDISKLYSLLPMDAKFKDEFNALWTIRTRFSHWWDSLKLELSRSSKIKWTQWLGELKEIIKIWGEIPVSDVFDHIVGQNLVVLANIENSIGSMLANKKEPISTGSGWYVNNSSERLFDDDIKKLTNVKLIGFCSGTLIPDNSLSIFEAEVGTKCTREPLVVPSPFDFKNMRFWIPKYGEMPGKSAKLNTELPMDREAFFDNYVCDFARTYIPPYVSQGLGGVLMLCSSYRRMELVHKALNGALNGHRLLVQGTMTKSALVGEFFDNPSSVLLGTDSFREGFDAPGKALTWVIVDRLPFPSPSNPELALRTEGLLRNGYISKPIEHVMKLMKFSLIQSIGRLIRTKNDYGTVTLLDSRGYYNSIKWGLTDCVPVPPCSWKTDWPSISDWVYENKKLAILACSQ